jgi:hypothetical protein
MGAAHLNGFAAPAVVKREIDTLAEWDAKRGNLAATSFQRSVDAWTYGHAAGVRLGRKHALSIVQAMERNGAGASEVLAALKRQLLVPVAPYDWGSGV